MNEKIIEIKEEVVIHNENQTITLEAGDKIKVLKESGLADSLVDSMITANGDPISSGNAVADRIVESLKTSKKNWGVRSNDILFIRGMLAKLEEHLTRI